MSEASTDRLDRAIAKAYETAGIGEDESNWVTPVDRIFARALIADLLEGLEAPKVWNLWEQRHYNRALADFRQRVGIGDQS